jgi:hypothetical protein
MKLVWGSEILIQVGDVRQLSGGGGCKTSLEGRKGGRRALRKMGRGMVGKGRLRATWRAVKHVKAENGDGGSAVKHVGGKGVYSTLRDPRENVEGRGVLSLLQDGDGVLFFATRLL